MVKFNPPLNIGAEALPRSNGWFLICLKKKNEEKDNIEGLLVLYQKKKELSISQINTEINKWHIGFLI